MQETAEAVRRLLCTTCTSLKRGVNETIRHILQLGPWTRENLDTERVAFTMCTLWEEIIERDIIAKLNENF
jgi:hypothetical protein